MSVCVTIRVGRPFAGWDAGVNAGEVAWLGEDGGRGNPPSKENDTQPAGGARRENGGERLLGWVAAALWCRPMHGQEPLRSCLTSDFMYFAWDDGGKLRGKQTPTSHPL